MLHSICLHTLDLFWQNKHKAIFYSVTQCTIIRCPCVWIKEAVWMPFPLCLCPVWFSSNTIWECGRNQWQLPHIAWWQHSSNTEGTTHTGVEGDFRAPMPGQFFLAFWRMFAARHICGTTLFFGSDPTLSVCFQRPMAGPEGLPSNFKDGLRVVKCC